MKKRVRKVGVLLLMVVMMLTGTVPAFASQSIAQTAKRYNVVLVIDGSGSLTTANGTDINGYRYKAIQAFLGVLTNDGNKVSAIVFNHEEEMPLDTGLNELTSMAEKKELASLIEKTGAEGDTDIGGALQRALDELQGNDIDPNIPSCILLFSDGETDLGNEKDTNASLAKKNQAVEEAKKLGIPIHGICLNTNNSANTKEVKSIAEDTEGIYIEIQNANDLDKAFLDFYSLIYGETIIKDEEECPVVKNFKIPSEGVVEVNILLETEGDNKVVTLTRPNGIDYSDVELEATSMSTGKYDIIKIVNPEAGVWTLCVDGAPGAKVKFDWIYNTDLSAEIECDTAEATLNTDIAIRGYLLSKNARVKNSDVYDEYTGTLILTNVATGESNNYPMETDGNSFLTNVQFSQYGTYNAAIQLVCGDIIHTSDSTQISVGNLPPSASQSVIAEKIMILPFKSAKAIFDMNDYVSDPEGEKLTFELKKYSYDINKVELTDGQLTVDAGNEKNGTVVIKATDSQGASCEVTVNIETKNLTMIFIIVLVLIVLIIVIIVLVNYKKKTSVVCPWTITVSSFDYKSGMSSQPYPQTGIKYKRHIRDWQITECGIDGEFHVEYVKGKKTGNLKFVSKQPFETESGQVAKEYKFMLGDDVRLFASAASEEERNSRGIRIIVTDSMDW